MSVNSNYQNMDQQFLIHLFSFCEPKALRMLTCVSSRWHSAATKAKTIYYEKQVQQGKCLSFPSRHPLYGIYELFNLAEDGIRVRIQEIQSRLMSIPLDLRREIFHELSTQKKTVVSVPKAAEDPRLKTVIAGVVQKRFLMLEPKMQRQVTYKIWKYYGCPSEEESGNPIRPHHFGRQMALHDIRCLIHMMHQTKTMDYAPTFGPSCTPSSCLLKQVLRVFDRIDENVNYLLYGESQGLQFLKMLERLPCYLRQRLIVVSHDPGCKIPREAAYQVFNLSFSGHNPKSGSHTFSEPFLHTILDFDNNDFLLASKSFPVRQKIQKFYLDAFLQWHHRNNALPQCNALFKQTLVLSALLLFRVNENASVQLMNDELQKLVQLWKSQGVGLEGEIDRNMYQMSRPPKKIIEGTNRFYNLKHFKMALVLTLDSLLYIDQNPKVGIAMKLFCLLDEMISDTSKNQQNRHKMDSLISVLHRLCRANRVDDYVDRYSSKPFAHSKWTVEHRYDSLHILRLALEDTLHSILFPN